MDQKSEEAWRQTMGETIPMKGGAWCPAPKTF